MPSSIKFNLSALQAAFEDIHEGVKEAGRLGMERAMAQAERDAQATAEWRSPGEYTEDYPSGEWTWTVTGLARSSITAYVVPNKREKHFPDYWTTSYWNGMPLKHPHSFDDGVTGTHAPVPDKVIGIVTMNAAYAPYLQDYERSIGALPITVEVLEMNWVPVYVPIINGVMYSRMGRIAAKYT